MGNSDKSLLEAHLRGDEAAFGQLVRRYADSLLGYLIKMTGSKDQAEDIFQDTFKKVHEKASTFRGSNFKSWLFAIATNLTIDNLRKKKRNQTVSLHACLDGNCRGDDPVEMGAVVLADADNDPVDKNILEEQKDQVRRAIDSLTQKQRITLILVYYQNLTYTEVARILNCSISTVKTQMSRALGSLAKMLPDSVGASK